ncbi:MAG TPA: hypothetical protein VMS76_18350 [Planctomycetota bacterium]|nr:hypothetical protein [Planctomycetota bacterium]
MDDPDQVASRLGERDDLDYDDKEGIWSWIRIGVPVAGIGEITRLGTLQLIGPELLLEVNSAGRFERARRWLEALPGVRFERVTVHDPDSDPLPTDDLLPGPRPGPPDPELMEHLREMQFATGLRWLDEPVPALGNLTPRAACATAEGRRRVAVMVRAMLPLGYPGGQLPAPTEQLLAELGIGAEE